MARYKHYDCGQMKLVPVSFEQQILPGTFEHTRSRAQGARRNAQAAIVFGDAATLMDRRKVTVAAACRPWSRRGSD
jgi:hypothetical protein